jgi:hypothetical protein
MRPSLLANPMPAMHHRFILLCLLAWLPGFALLAQEPEILPLSQVLIVDCDADFAAVQTRAADLAAGRQPLGYSTIKAIPKGAPESAWEILAFEGSLGETPETAITQEGLRLALLSDDGCDVYIKKRSDAIEGWPESTRILHRAGQAQHLPDLSQSLLQLNCALEPEAIYDLRLVYSNIEHPSDADRDGLALFLYSLPDPTAGWSIAFRSMNVETLHESSDGQLDLEYQAHTSYSIISPNGATYNQYQLADLPVSVSVSYAWSIISKYTNVFDGEISDFMIHPEIVEATAISNAHYRFSMSIPGLYTICVKNNIEIIGK